MGLRSEFSEEFAGGGVDDPDVEVVDEEDDGGSGVGSADADVVESAGDAEGDDSVVIDLSCRMRWWFSPARSAVGAGFGSGLVAGGRAGLNRHGFSCRSHAGCGSRLRAA